MDDLLKKEDNFLIAIGGMGVPCHPVCTRLRERRKPPNTSSSRGASPHSLGKGIISASLAKLLQARSMKVTIQKLDPYINIDPGTESL